MTRWDDPEANIVADLEAAIKAVEESEPQPTPHYVHPKTRRCLTCGDKHEEQTPLDLP